MAEGSSNCASCGAALPTPDAVCPRCEQTLLNPDTDPTIGRYQCPGCSGRFDHPELAWWPRDVPWYRPQVQKTQCPHCKAFLRDKKAARFSSLEYGAVIALVLASNFAPWRPQTQIILLVALCLFQFIRWRRANASVSIEAERYAMEKSGA